MVHGAVAEVEQVLSGQAGTLFLVDGDGGGANDRITPDDDHGKVALNRRGGLHDVTDRRHDDNALDMGSADRSRVIAISSPDAPMVTKLSVCPDDLAAASMPYNVCDGPNCWDSTAMTPMAPDRRPARTTRRCSPGIPAW